MHESQRPEDLGDRRTAIATEPDDDAAAADPRSEPGARGTVARLPYWFIVGAVALAAAAILYLAWTAFPAR